MEAGTFSQQRNKVSKRNAPAPGDMADIIGHRAGHQHRQRRPHRGRVGIVALVDQHDLAVDGGRAQFDPPALAAAPNASKRTAITTITEMPLNVGRALDFKSDST